MNHVIASTMLAILEQSHADNPYDDAYFIVHRLLTAEVRKGDDPEVMLNARRQFLIATRDELMVWIGNKVQAMRMYRERTGSGLYEAKMQLEAAERALRISGNTKVEVTSCC